MKIDIEGLNAKEGICVFEHKQTGEVAAFSLNGNSAKFFGILTFIMVFLFFYGVAPLGAAVLPTLTWLLSKKLWSKFFLFLFVVTPLVSVLPIGLSMGAAYALKNHDPNDVVRYAVVYFFLVPSSTALLYIHRLCAEKINSWTAYKYIKKGFRFVAVDETSSTADEAIGKFFAEVEVK